jgi:hypothetical protein
MNELFISYSRRDTDFARNLAARFETEGMGAWVDWQDIPPSVDWMKEIRKGIEEADIFLFLISPDSVSSKACADEVEHAVLNNKRIIPIIVREIDPKNAPAAITRLNWIFFSRPEDKFDASFARALEAIRTDYDWVQMHREVQVKALEWERNKYEDSFLLRGKELEDARAQLMVNGEKNPHSTDLQRQYILKSATIEKEQIERQQAEKAQLEMEKHLGLRLRRLTYLLLGVFTIAYIALFFWLNQVTGTLAINSVKNQMLALVETTVCFMYGDQFEPFINAYPPKDNLVYAAEYYKTLTSYMENVKSMNENIAETDIVLYTIIKGSKADEYLVINSTAGQVGYKTAKFARNTDAAQIVGMKKTVADITATSEDGTWISACSPILNSAGKSVGALCADFNARLLKDTHRKVIITLVIAFIAIYPAMIILVLFTTRSMSKKIRPVEKNQK